MSKGKSGSIIINSVCILQKIIHINICKLLLLLFLPIKKTKSLAEVFTYFSKCVLFFYYFSYLKTLAEYICTLIPLSNWYKTSLCNDAAVGQLALVKENET